MVAALLPTVRDLTADAPARTARAFNRIAWPAFAITVLTGLWNVMAIPVQELPHPWIELHVVAVVVTGAAAAIHAQVRGNKALAGATMGLSSIAAIAAMYLGIVVTSTVG